MQYRKPSIVNKKTSVNEQANSKKRKQLPSQQSTHIEQQQPKKRGRPRKEKITQNYDVSRKNHIQIECYCQPYLHNKPQRLLALLLIFM